MPLSLLFLLNLKTEHKLGSDQKNKIDHEKNTPYKRAS